MRTKLIINKCKNLKICLEDGCQTLPGSRIALAAAKPLLLIEARDYIFGKNNVSAIFSKGQRIVSKKSKYSSLIQCCRM